MTASARSIPAFAKDFPRHPELDRLVDLFEQGNYALVRKEARALLQRTADAAPKASATKAAKPYREPAASPDPSPDTVDDDALRAAARELLKRIEPDPLTLYLLAIASGLLVILAGWYWTHPHDPPPAPPPYGPVSTP